MVEHYDNICSLCGEVIEEVAYHCCTKCHREHKRKDKEVMEELGEQKESEVLGGEVS
jgi:hypothetical protein